MSKKVFIMARNKDYALDAMRSTLGLSVENMYSFCSVLGVELDEFDDYNKENLEWTRDMEGDVYSDVDANVSKNDLTKATIEEIGQKLRDMDIIVPYGVI